MAKIIKYGDIWRFKKDRSDMLHIQPLNTGICFWNHREIHTWRGPSLFFRLLKSNEVSHPKENNLAFLSTSPVCYESKLQSSTAWGIEGWRQRDGQKEWGREINLCFPDIKESFVHSNHVQVRLRCFFNLFSYTSASAACLCDPAVSPTRIR